VRRHVPYRDSKLTFLLRESLGGNSRTCSIVTSESGPSHDLNPNMTLTLTLTLILALCFLFSQRC